MIVLLVIELTISIHIALLINIIIDILIDYQVRDFIKEFNGESTLKYYIIVGAFQAVKSFVGKWCSHKCLLKIQNRGLTTKNIMIHNCRFCLTQSIVSFFLAFLFCLKVMFIYQLLVYVQVHQDQENFSYGKIHASMGSNTIMYPSTGSP